MLFDCLIYLQWINPSFFWLPTGLGVCWDILSSRYPVCWWLCKNLRFLKLVYRRHISWRCQRYRGHRSDIHRRLGCFYVFSIFYPWGLTRYWEKYCPGRRIHLEVCCDILRNNNANSIFSFVTFLYVLLSALLLKIYQFSLGVSAVLQHCPNYRVFLFDY
jgi:hypothetical protein